MLPQQQSGAVKVPCVRDGTEVGPFEYRSRARLQAPLVEESARKSPLFGGAGLILLFPVNPIDVVGKCFFSRKLAPRAHRTQDIPVHDTFWWHWAPDSQAFAPGLHLASDSALQLLVRSQGRHPPEGNEAMRKSPQHRSLDWELKRWPSQPLGNQTLGQWEPSLHTSLHNSR